MEPIEYRPETVWTGKLMVDGADGPEEVHFRTVWDGIDLHVERAGGVDRMGCAMWFDVPHMETQAYVYRQMLVDAYRGHDQSALTEAGYAALESED